jgi:undecaprenyl-diphosphatase
VPDGFEDLVERVHAIDEAIEKRLEPHRSPALDAFFYRLSSAADHGLLWLALGSLRAARRRDRGIALRTALVLGAESAFTNGFVKSFFRRVRPTHHFEHVGPLPYAMHRPITTSFPSGHAATAFTAATLLSHGTRTAPMYFSLATVVAASRVYVRMHHTSDVVAGALLGLCLGQIARRVLPLDGRRSRRG